jgi:riboflavin synthase
MAAHTRFGGHMVQVSLMSLENEFKEGGITAQGHVDTTATITSKKPDGDSIRYNFALENPAMMPYIIEKGYITIDGASLTITEIDDKSAGFGIMLISHSQSILTLTGKEVSLTRTTSSRDLRKSLS